MKITKDIYEKVSKYTTADQFLRAGGLDTNTLDKMAFGFSEDEIKTLEPNQLNIKWKDDWNNVKEEVQNSGLSKTAWAKKINLSEPIEVSYKKGKFWVEDGHHRTFAAKVLKKPLNISLSIEENPIIAMGYDSYDKFMIDLFNKVKSMKINESFISKILIESYVTELPASVKKFKNKQGAYDVDVNSIFLHPFNKKLASAESALEDEYDWNGGKEKYNASFFETGVMKITLPVSVIYPGQPGLESNNLIKILNASDIKELPQAVKVTLDGQKYIVLIDGHHRVASQILKGNDRVELMLKFDNFI